MAQQQPLQTAVPTTAHPCTVPSPLAILSNVLTQVAAEYSRENMLRSDWVPRRIQYVAAPTMDAMYRKVMDRNNQWASNTDPEAMIVLRERLRAVVPVTSPARRVASAGRGGGAAAAGVASTVSDAADQTKCGACTSDDVPVGPHGYVIACKQYNMHYHPRCVLFGMARDDFSGHYICDHCIATKRGSPGLPSSNPTIGSKRDAPPPPTAECSKPKRKRAPRTCKQCGHSRDQGETAAFHGANDGGCLLEHIALKDCTHLRATFVRHNSRKLPAYATIVCDVCIQGDLTVSHATSQRWSNLAKLGSALPPGMHKTTPSPSDAFFDLQKASFT